MSVASRPELKPIPAESQLTFPAHASLLTTDVHFVVSYGAATSLCSIIIASEASLGAGIAWSAAICCLGCPWACIWACIQLYRHGSLELAGTASARIDGAPRSSAATAALVFLPLYAVFFQVFFVVTCVKHPLVPFKTDDLSWALWWLLTTCSDYYGCCLV